MLQGEAEEPFSTAEKHFSRIRRLPGTDHNVVLRYQNHLIQEARMADCQRECNQIKRQMQKKDVQAPPIGAARYNEWLDPSRLDNLEYKPDDTGIPLLR
jgi:hypothetical protein